MPGNAEVRPGKYRMGVMVELPYNKPGSQTAGLYLLSSIHPNYMFYQISTWATIAIFVVVVSFSAGYLIGLYDLKKKKP